MNTCGQCQHYGEAPTKGPICTKTWKEVSFLQAGKSCWEERAAGQDVITKVCSRCHRSLALTEFSRNHSARDGYQHECKDCQRELAQAYMAKKDAATSPPPDQERKTKRCPKCGRELPLERFGKNKRTTDGLKCYCKECENKNVHLDYLGRMYRRDGLYPFETEGTRFMARVIGVNDDGRLMLQNDEGIAHLYRFKEITFIIHGDAKRQSQAKN
jgi:hypothetical protein